MKKSKMKIVLVLFAFVALLTLTGCKKKFELKFVTNGASEIASVTVKNKTEYQLPTPSWEGYIFDGWYASSDFSGNSITSVKVTGNTSVYAKWTKLGKITLDLDGGSCSTTVIYGKDGETVLSLLNGITPSKNGVIFGGWFVDGKELDGTTKLTTDGLTLKARYKAEYTIEVYKENIAKDGYDVTTIKEYEYVDKKINANLTYPGFSVVEKGDTIASITINENASTNVMRIYFDRNTYTITFDSNYPTTELETEKHVEELLYGKELDLPTLDYACEGYYLLGWSTSKDGKVMYPAHFIEKLPVNQEDDVTFDPVKITTDKDIILYAIWNKGYTDMFGGSDYIFLEESQKTVYLLRGNSYFKGEYFDTDHSFMFENGYDNLEGKLFDNGTFAYYNAQRDEYSATLYQTGVGMNEDDKILFDAYNGITYSKRVDETRTDLSNGVYTIDEDGYYIATFYDGTLQGVTLTIELGTVTLENGKQNAFRLRNQEEFELGELVRFIVYNGEITYYTSAYTIILSGLGTALYNTGSGYATYTYTYDSTTDRLVLTNPNDGSVFKIGQIMESNGKKGYMEYDESLDTVFNGENGETLELDGLYIATYTDKDGNLAVGNYVSTDSYLGDKVVSFTFNNKEYIFVTTSRTEEEVVGDETTTKVINEFVKKPVGYAEYVYKNVDGYFYAPFVVLNDTTEGVASIYGYTKSRTFELILEGTYVYDETTRLYTFTKVTSYEKDVLNDLGIDYQSISKIVFGVDESSNIASNYWYSVEANGETITYDVDYTSSEGVNLKLVAGFAILSKGENVIVGQYQTKGGLTTVSTAGGALYLELDEENKTFILLAHAPFNAYVVLENGKYSQNEYITFDGKGNAIYVYYKTELVGEGEDAKEESVQYTINGTFKALEEKTAQGAQVYQFTSDEKTFKFIQLTISGNAFVLPYYGTYYGTYTSTNGVLEVDGYGYYATYTDKEGNIVSGVYAVEKENVIKITGETRYYYFDITSRTFTVRGDEYATYMLMKNNGPMNLYFEFNGYGVTTVYKMETNAEGKSEKVVIDEKATYVLENGKYKVVYLEGNVEKTIEGLLSTYTYSNMVFNTFVIENESVVNIYLNKKDWSILKLDSIGHAIKIDKNGIEESGTYMIITDTLLYYVNDNGTDANIFKFDTKNGTITEERFTPRGYYTKDLKSLLFSQYGFAIFNNETRYYYTMEGEDVIIYHQEPENPNANAYGFVEENFGPFKDQLQFEDQTYYENDGYAINFTRKEETKDKYPILLTNDPETYAPVEELIFTPSGSDTFRVPGSVKIDGKNYSCTVVKELVDGEYQMYFMLGYYRFDFNATFTGKNESGQTDSYYEVTALSFVREFYPYMYLDMYYLLYSFLGPSVASTYENQLGMFYQYRIFDEQGKEVENYMKLDFYEKSGATDLEGVLLSNEKVQYTEENGTYTIELTGTDGYTYKLYFSLKLHQSFGMYAYQIRALTRVETITDGAYSLTVERIIVTDSNYEPGTLWTSELTKDGVVVETNEKYIINDVLNYIIRTTENDVITSTKYYRLNLVSKDASSIEEGEKVVQPYISLSVEELDATTYYDAEKKTYFDVINNEVILIAFGNNKYAIKATTYDEATKTYTITLYSDVQYTLVIGEDGVATITKVEVTTEEETTK